MGDYIEREAALIAIKNLYPSVPFTKLLMERWHKENKAYMECEMAIEKLHAANVRPVVRGKWERMSDNDVFGDIHCKCSACGEDWWQGPGWFRNANFCPNCGADMREAE